MSKPNENATHRQAFELYADLRLNGEDDIFEKVADESGVKIRTAYNWSSRYKWDDRFKDIEREAHRKMMDKMGKNIEDMKIGLVNHYIGRLKELQCYEMPIAEDGLSFARQEETVMKNFMLLVGEATERTESTNSTAVSLNEQDQDTINELSGTINELIGYNSGKVNENAITVESIIEEEEEVKEEKEDE